MNIKSKILAGATTYSLIDYQTAYGTEFQCFQFLCNLKWKDGFKCSKCGCTHACTIKKRSRFLMQCNDCRYQESAIVGTVMSNTKLSLPKWFLAFYFIAQNKNGISGVGLAKLLGIALSTSWSMLLKIRESMSKRDKEYYLSGIVEMDETFIGAKDKGGKRGRGADKIKVSVSVQLSPAGHPMFVKMKVIPNTKGETIKEVVQESIRKGSTIFTDGCRSYNILNSDYVVDSKKNDLDNKDYLKWMHVVISNVKSVISGTYHGLDEDYIQGYLNEFCYRFNRRHCKLPIVDHLINCVVNTGYMRLADLCI